MRQAVLDLADDLLELYAAREQADGFSYPDDTTWQRELEESFPFTETPDQERTIEEVARDMARRRPMDRLVAGDVGYGKTEVALRAAFRVVEAGRQAAVLVPTTVLAQQHLLTFQRRLAAFPVKVEMLSRFVSKGEQQRIVAELAAGTVDVVVGTHRLLSRDVSFADLGLLVVDEEQRFGVAQKEKIKQLRREVDVLTLSATPIPRTLHLSLVGIRDLSVIETAPEARLPILTRIAEDDDGLVRDAIVREIDRGGQVFYVHNRVETIEGAAARVRKLVPRARVAIGHGQMAEGMLERVMLDFDAGLFDVLVCTTIIESGLDIPNANTMLIARADTFGLAQLYQLRGRVGRSDRRAYAYLLHRRGFPLSGVARRRLHAIFSASDLGAGYQIALSDLEIRGAGNILGAEQSGYMAAIGFELYTQLLAEAVDLRRGRIPPPEPAPVRLELPGSAFLPDEYVGAAGAKLEIYRRFSQVKTDEDAEALRAHLLDRFGPIPPEVEGLFRAVAVRLAAEAAGVSEVRVDEGRLTLKWRRYDRAVVTRALTLAGFRPVAGSNQVRIPLVRGRDPVETILKALAAVVPVEAMRDVTRSRLELTRTQILAFRRNVQALDERLPPGPDSLRHAAWAGLQDSMPRAALLSIHARVAGTQPSTWEDPSLVQVWGPRFSVYVIPAPDRRGRSRSAGGPTMRAAGASPRRWRPACGTSSAIGGCPIARSRGRWASATRIRYAAPTGTILIRWEGARAPTIWAVTAPDVEPMEARIELARRYLHVFGPTTPQAFAQWAGIGAAQGGAAFDALGESLTPVRTPVGDRWILGSDEPTFRAPAALPAPARLLPSGDTYYLLWGADRELLVPEADRRSALWTSRVWPGAVLVRGEVVGTWRRAGASVSIRAWRRMSAADRAAIEAEAESLPLPELAGRSAPPGRPDR